MRRASCSEKLTSKFLVLAQKCSTIVVPLKITVEHKELVVKRKVY